MKNLRTKKVPKPHAPAPTLFEDNTLITKVVIEDTKKLKSQDLDISKIGINPDWENFGDYIKSLGNGSK